MASKIHSASGGVSASQALDDEEGDLNIGDRASGAIVAEKSHTSGEQGVDCCESQESRLGGERISWGSAQLPILVLR